MRNTLVLLLGAALMAGCHGRFKRAAPNLGAVSVDMVAARGPSVALPMVGGDSPVSAAVNITQMVRQGNIAAHIAEKVDPEQVNQAFADGFAQALDDGPPFAFAPDAKNVLQFELVDWGMEIYGPFSPGVFNYDLRVRGYRGDGKLFYKTRVRCATDAGTQGWSEMTPFGDNNPNRIKNLPAEDVQRIFDATAADCARQALLIVRQHAG